MRIIKPSVEFITPIDGNVILKRLEECGRVCYKSEHRITDTSAPAFVAKLIQRGHEAVLEHCSFTVKFICDRGVSHEIVRHRAGLLLPGVYPLLQLRREGVRPSDHRD